MRANIIELIKAQPEKAKDYTSRFFEQHKNKNNNEQQ